MAKGKKSEYTDTMGRFRTKSLFVETIDTPQKQAGMLPIYSLKGREGYIDIHEMYIEISDVTEYEFAMKAFNSWKHFKHLESLKWFSVFLEEWREELEVSIRSKSIKGMLEVATQEGAKGITAAKWLADKGWIKTRGRPSKEEVTREVKQHAGIQQAISEDARRLGLH